jgi:hypothetical protein
MNFLYFPGTALIPRQVLDILKCDGTIPMSPGAGRTRCNFPGAAVLEAVERLYTLHLSVDRMLADSTVKGWMTPYNVDHGFSSPSHVCTILLLISSHYTAIVRCIFDIHNVLVGGFTPFFIRLVVTLIFCYI